MNKRAREAEPLEHAGGVSPCLAVERVQPEQIGKLSDPARGLRARAIVKGCKEGEIVAAGQPAIKTFFYTCVIADVFASRGWVAESVLASDFNSSAGWDNQRGEDAEQRRFACTIFSHQGYGLSGLDRKGNSAERAQRLPGEWVP